MLQSYSIQLKFIFIVSELLKEMKKFKFNKISI